MRNRRLIEELIPVAIDKLVSVKIIKNNETIPKACNGYISSFATSVVQAGLRQSVLFFSNRDAATESERWKIIELIFEVLKESKKIDDGPQSLSEYVTAAPAKAREDILDAAVACKLAMRSFKPV